MTVARKWEFPTIDHHVGGEASSFFAEKYHDRRCRIRIVKLNPKCKGVKISSKVSICEVNLLHRFDFFHGWNGFKRMFICCKFWESHQRQQQ